MAIFPIFPQGQFWMIYRQHLMVNSDDGCTIFTVESVAQADPGDGCIAEFPGTFPCLNINITQSFSLDKRQAENGNIDNRN